MRQKKLKSILACFAALMMLTSAGIFSLADEGSLSGNSLSGNTLSGNQLQTDSALQQDETQAAQGQSSLSANVLPEVKAGEIIPGTINHLTESAEGVTYDIGENTAAMIHSPGDEPIIFRNCTFHLSGGTVKISGNQGVSYKNGEVVTKLWIGTNVQFENCVFLTGSDACKTTTAGYDACIYFYSGDILLKDCTLSANGYNGQFLGLYGSSGSVTFDHCNISTVNQKNGWSYAMYAGSVLKLVNHSSMTATGMATDSGNINAFYSGDNKTEYDAIFIEDSVVDFSDNRAGGFAINNINIHIDHSEIYVNNNQGNACNSGYWIVNDSTIQMNGNRGGHALSCIGFEMTGSAVEILHNGYAGVYLQSKDSSFTDCTVDIRCNGERMLSYSAGDVWLQGHTLTVSNGTSNAYPGAAWLGGVGHTGAVATPAGSVVAYDLNSNAADNLKSNTSPVLTNASLALNTEENSHTLLLNPFMKTPYARGNGESNLSSNDADLFQDQNVTDRKDILAVRTERDEETKEEKTFPKIGVLTDAQLAHHKYDWASGEVTDQATADAYGAIRYGCANICADYADHTEEHPNSFDCTGTYVYAPLVGLEFNANAGTDPVANMPGSQTDILYQTAAKNPTPAAETGFENAPVREGYTFTGWYTDAGCTKAYDFSTKLTQNWTVVYAGWEPDVIVEYQWVGKIQPSDVKPPESVSRPYGTEYTADSQEPSEGYLFDGWYTDTACTEPFADETPLISENLNGDHKLTLYGRWTEKAAETTPPDNHENWIIARKVWSDETAEHPTIWFKLYRQTPEGQPEAVPGAELKMLENGRTEVAWDGLDLATPQGQPYTFFVKETDENGNSFTPDGYVKQESGLTVINTYVGTAAPGQSSLTGQSGQSPKTGDSAPVLLYAGLLCLAGGAAAVIIVKKSRDKSK